jgi:3-oxoacyl-[acyl-carrier protein] reductase
MRGLAGRVAVVTGAARGIGQTIATELAQYGVRVALLDLRSCAETLGLITASGGDGIEIPTDVTRLPEVESAAEELHNSFGHPDFLVNNAGGVTHAPILEMAVENWNQVLGLNLTAAFHTVRTFAPAMVERRAGAIVNVASTSARFSWPRTAHYSAAKAGLVALTRCIAYELGSAGVRANSVSPATIATPAWGSGLENEGFAHEEAAATALGRIGEPTDVARVVAFLLSDEARYVTGEDILCDGGYSLTGQTHGARPHITLEAIPGGAASSRD